MRRELLPSLLQVAGLIMSPFSWLWYWCESEVEYEGVCLLIVSLVRGNLNLRWLNCKAELQPSNKRLPADLS